MDEGRNLIKRVFTSTAAQSYKYLLTFISDILEKYKVLLFYS